MYGNWVCFVVLDLIIVTFSTPGRFHHDYYSGQDRHGSRHEYSGHTTQRTGTKIKTTAAAIREYRRSATLPHTELTKSDVEMRLREFVATTDAPISQSTKEAFAPGPEDTETSAAAASIKTMPDGSRSQLVKAEAHANQETLQVLQAFAPELEDRETSVAVPSVKTIRDASSSQFVNSDTLADQQTLQAFAPGPQDRKTEAAASVKTMPDASSSQFVKAEQNQQTSEAIAPGSEDGKASVAAATVKTLSDASSSQIVKAGVNQQTLQGIPPGSEDGETSIAAATVNTLSDASSSQFVQAGALNKAQSFRPDGEYEDMKRLLDATTVKPDASGLEAKPYGKISLWHVAVYRERVMMNGRYDLICGGSLVKEYIVVSAGNCFSSLPGMLLDTSLFRLAAGKIHPGYDDPQDTGAQYSTVEKITITKMEEPCYQPDLAVINLATPFKYTAAVKPLCVNFFWEQEQQLKKDNVGKVASWAVFEDGECLPKPSESLYWLSLPFVERDVCQVKTSSKTIGSDRICAGELNNTSQCFADSGNGLVFYQGNVPYLRGVTTDNYINLDQCTKFYTRSFSNIIGSGNYLERLLNQSNNYVNFDDCEDIYKANPTEAPKTNDGDGVSPTEATMTVTADDGFALSGGTGQRLGVRLQSIGSLPVPLLEGTSSAPVYQWHVGIYSKTWEPFMQICGGTIVKRDFVISAAHCFWDDTAGQQPASQFGVAAGKLFRPWNYTQDTYAQYSDVSKIILPVRFRGSATSFQDDIAILRLSSPFTYGPGVQPACVSFNAKFERKQLQPLNFGMVLGWGLTAENGGPSQRLNFIDLQYVDVEDCFTDSEPSFLKYITSDKICAGDTISGNALCRGDSGGGYVIDTIGPYLHGVASTAAGNKNLCNAFALAAITSTYSHRGFITDNIPDIENECADAAGIESYIGGTGNNMGTGNVVSTAKAPTLLDRNVESTSVGTGNVGSTGNQGLNAIGAPGNQLSVASVFSQLPFYPLCNCNCNCKT